MEAELGPGQPEATLGQREQDLLELGHELPSGSDAEVAAPVLAGGVGAELGGQCGEPARVALHLGQDPAGGRLVGDQDVAGEAPVVLRRALLVGGLQQRLRHLDVLDEPVPQRAGEHQVPHHRVDPLLRDPALRGLGDQLLARAHALDDLRELGVHVAVGDADPALGGRDREHAPLDQRVEGLPLEGGAVLPQLLPRLRVDQGLVDDALEVGRRDPLVADERGRACAELTVAAAAQQQHGQASRDGEPATGAGHDRGSFRAGLRAGTGCQTQREGGVRRQRRRPP